MSHSTVGPVLIKPKIVGLDFHDLHRLYGQNLPSHIVEGLRDYFEFIQAVSRTVHVEVLRNGKTVSEGLSIDLRPPNLVWIEDSETMNLLGLKRPAFVSFELSQLQNNEPRYLDARMSFDKYLQLFMNYSSSE